MLASLRNIGHRQSDNLLRREANVSRHINIIGHYNNDTLIDKNSQLIQIIRLAGIDGVTQSEATLDAYKNRRNSLFKNFSSEYAIYFWTVRRKTMEYPGGEFKPGFAQQLNDNYRKRMQQQPLFYHQHYLGIVTKPTEGVLNKGFDWIKKISQQTDHIAQQRQLGKIYLALTTITQNVLHALSDYQPQLLSLYQKGKSLFSEPLEFVGQLINYDKQTVPLLFQDASTYLPRKRLFFNRHSGTIEFRAGDQSKKFAAVLAIKTYPSITYQGLLDQGNFSQ